jgi:hypothetical protein
VLNTGKSDRPWRYLHRTIVIDEDGTKQLMGLVALHILRYVLIDEGDGQGLKKGYVAATFEQVDNVDASPGVNPSSRLYPDCPNCMIRASIGSDSIDSGRRASSPRLTLPGVVGHRRQQVQGGEHRGQGLHLVI